MQAQLTAGWVIGAAMRPLAEFAAGTDQYPNVGVGEEGFRGYD